MVRIFHEKCMCVMFNVHFLEYHLVDIEAGRIFWWVIILKTQNCVGGLDAVYPVIGAVSSVKHRYSALHLSYVF